jgi:hypothetical protein
MACTRAIDEIQNTEQSSKTSKEWQLIFDFQSKRYGKHFSSSFANSTTVSLPRLSLSSMALDAGLQLDLILFRLIVEIDKTALKVKTKQSSNSTHKALSIRIENWVCVSVLFLLFFSFFLCPLLISWVLFCLFSVLFFSLFCTQPRFFIVSSLERPALQTSQKGWENTRRDCSGRVKNWSRCVLWHSARTLSLHLSDLFRFYFSFSALKGRQTTTSCISLCLASADRVLSYSY